MYTCSISLSLSLSDAVHQDIDVRISTSEDEPARDSGGQDVEVRVCAAETERGVVVAMPAPRREPEPASEASRLEDEYVLGGYAGI
ncbi:MAG: hypothetical protein J0I74_10240 [Rhodanobacter sp.]|uniref:Uncharacterized protein n=1 Tax=Rhodanobacter geophilus TaxID=3162488 RepID=A0ABV3QP57_9GAMM|nr:hypothetical protein [Rhodanobacter sp.]